MQHCGENLVYLGYFCLFYLTLCWATVARLTLFYFYAANFIQKLRCYKHLQTVAASIIA
jgi:hypothetical protein